MDNIKNKITAFSSFKSNYQRDEICAFNLNYFIKNRPFNIDFYIQESASEQDSIKSKINLDDNCLYEIKNNNFIQSWVELLERAQSDYCLSVFDDFFFYGLDEQVLKSCVELLDSDSTIDCILIDNNVLNSYDDDKKEIYLDKQYIHQRNNSPCIVGKAILNGVNFNIINNSTSQFVYSWFMNTAIFRREKYLESLKFFGNYFTNPHQAELNHTMCPNHLRLNKIATFENSICGMVDIGYVHILGIRQPNSGSELYFQKLKQGYKILV